MKKPDKAVTETLTTLRDYVRLGVSEFTKANLFYGHGTSGATEEALFILSEALALPPGEDITIHLDAKLLPGERELCARLIHERVTTRKPAPYLVNRAYIQGLPFYVDERVIVPRSYIAELLCAEDSALPLMNQDEITSVLDLCTGSACLAILAAQIFPNAAVDAVDLSSDALDVARRNVADHMSGERVTLHAGDLFAPLENNKYDLIITNPPYVDQEGMDHLPPEYEHEPVMALAAGDDGLDIVHRILKEAPEHLNPGGGLLCEVGRCREALEAACPDLPFLWLDTENSNGEVFFLTREQLS